MMPQLGPPSGDECPTGTASACCRISTDDHRIGQVHNVTLAGIALSQLREDRLQTPAKFNPSDGYFLYRDTNAGSGPKSSRKPAVGVPLTGIDLNRTFMISR
jgi:hypothetical protein